MITIEQAEDLVKEGIKNFHTQESAKAKEYAPLVEMHVHLVAQAARLIAERVPGMDTDKAYIFGLLHDYGKFCGDYFGKAYFHGLRGYQKMKELGHDDIAKINLTHSFFEKDFPVEEYAYHKADTQKVKEIMQGLEFDDYDRLIQLSDLLVNNQTGGFNRIEEKMARLKKNYNFSDYIEKRVIKKAEETKAYFEQKCGCDIYKLLGIE